METDGRVREQTRKHDQTKQSLCGKKGTEFIMHATSQHASTAPVVWKRIPCRQIVQDTSFWLLNTHRELKNFHILHRQIHGIRLWLGCPVLAYLPCAGTSSQGFLFPPEPSSTCCCRGWSAGWPSSCTSPCTLVAVHTVETAVYPTGHCTAPTAKARHAVSARMANVLCSSPAGCVSPPPACRGASR